MPTINNSIMSGEISRMKTYLKGVDDAIMINSTDIFPSDFSPIATGMLKISIKEPFPLLKFQASIINALRSLNTVLSARVWRRLVRFLEWGQDPNVCNDQSNQMKYEILLVITKGNPNELFTCRTDKKSFAGPDEYFNNLLSNIINTLMMTAIYNIQSVFEGDGIVNEFKKFLNSEAIILAMRSTLAQVFPLMNDDEYTTWIRENINKMAFYSTLRLNPLHGVTLRSGILLIPVTTIISYFEYSTREKAAILTLICHETVHYLARVFVDDFNFSSPFSTFAFANTPPRHDFILDGKGLELGRAIELNIFGIQPNWSATSDDDLEAAGAAFIERALVYTELPLFTKEDLDYFKITERQHPSVSFAADLLYEIIPDPHLDC